MLLIQQYYNNTFCHFNYHSIFFLARNAIKDSYNLGLYMLLRPHVVVYLDASVDAVMKNVKERDNPWDKVMKEEKMIDRILHQMRLP